MNIRHLIENKLIGIATVVVFLLMSISAFAESGTETEYIKEYEVLKSIGVVIDDFSAERDVTRAETAKVLCEIGGYQPQSGETGFFDVPKSHRYAGYIGAACDAGLMRGCGENVFEPDRVIAYSDLVKVVLDMMGYGDYAGMSGGYPNGYLKYASNMNLTKGTDGITINAPLSCKNFSKVIYNALDKEVMQKEISGSVTRYTTEEGETYGYKYMNVRKGEGRVVATDGTAIIGNPLGEGMIKIDDKIIIDKSGEGKLLLGYETEFWVRELDKYDVPELLCIIPDDDQKVICLRNYDIVDINTSRLYYVDNNKKKYVNLSDDMVCIYNGDVIDYTSEELKPYDGMVKIIINSDNRATVAVVTNYTYGVVKGISSASNKIVFYDGKTLNLDDYKEWKLIKGGNEIEFIELVQGDVLNIMVSKDGTKLCAEVFGGKISGRITGITNDEDRMVVELDTIADGISVSPNYNKTEEIQNSYQGEWYTNILGDIFYSTSIKSGTMQYGYMKSYAMLDREESVVLKIFTSDGEFIKPYTKKKVTLVESDGKNSTTLTYDKFGEYLTLNDIQPQLIKYTLDDEGFLRKIQFSELNYNKDTGENIREIGSYPVGAFTCDYISEGETTGYYQIGIFDCKYFLDPNAVIFKVPENKREEKEYSVISRADMTRKQYYAAELYDVDESFESDACVINLKGKASNFNWETTLLAIIDKITFEYIESEGEVAIALNIYQGGKEGKIYCTDTDLATQETVQDRYEGVRAWELNEGDVIAYIADSEGIIKKFELMYSPSREDGSYFMYSNEEGMPNKNDYSSELYLAHGIIKGISDNGLVINAKGGGSDSSWNHYLAYEASNTRTYLFDSRDKKWKSVSFSSLNKDDTVVVRMLGYSLRDVLIYE